MNLSTHQPFTSRAHRLLNWGHWFTFFNILIALTISVTYIAPDATPQTVLGWVYLLTNWVSHTAFICFVCFLLTIFPVSMVFPYQHHIRGVSAVIATAGILLLTIDAYSFNRLGYHISNASLDQVVSLLTRTWGDHPVRSTLWVTLITVCILGYELLISNFTWKRIIALKEKQLHRIIVSVFIGCFFTSHLIHIWADANLKYDITQQDNMFPLSYPTTAKSLLARYDLLDKENYQQEKSKTWQIKSRLNYQPDANRCEINEVPSTSLTIDVVDRLITPQEQDHLLSAGFIAYDNHFQSLDPDDAAFSLLFGLPSLYSEYIASQQIQPAWFTVAKAYNINVVTTPDVDALSHKGFSESPVLSLNLDSNLSISGSFNDNHIIVTRDTSMTAGPLIKSAIYVKWHKPVLYRHQITTNASIAYSILADWMKCGELAENTTIATSLFDRDKEKLKATYTADTLAFFHKDKITLVTSQGTDQHYSAASGMQLDVNLDTYELTDAINLITRFSRQEPGNLAVE